MGYCFESDQPDSSWFLSFESNCKSAVSNCGDDVNCAYQNMKSYENNHCKGTLSDKLVDVNNTTLTTLFVCCVLTC